MSAPPVEVWVATFAGPLSHARRRRLAALASDAERAAAARFHQPERRDQALVARALTRLVLSERFGGPPSAWKIVAGLHGRPTLAGGGGGRDFNVAHTEGCVVLAVGDACRVGIDVESFARSVDVDRVSSRILAPSEAALLGDLPGAERGRRLVRLWTLKEAWAKARGDGLGLDFTTVAFDAAFGPGGESFRLPALPDSRFEVFETAAGHAVALAILCDGHTAWPVVCRDANAMLFGTVS